MQMNTGNELFWKLLEKDYEPAMLFCRKLMFDRDKGDDLFQDSLVIACTHFKSLRDTKSFRSWFYRIIINCFKMTVRSPWWKKRKFLSQEIQDSLTTSDLNNQLIARRWLSRALAVISTEEKTLVVLHEMDGWTISELADLYNKSESAIKVRLFRARKKMKTSLEKWMISSSESNKLINTNGESVCVAARQNTD